MSVSEELVRGKKVLLVWHGGHSPDALQPVVEGLRAKAGNDGTVLLEHAQRLNIGKCLCVVLYTPQCSLSFSFFHQLVTQPPPLTPFSLGWSLPLLSPTPLISWRSLLDFSSRLDLSS